MELAPHIYPTSLHLLIELTQWKLSSINNGILEGLDSIIQATKRKARGYGKKHFKTMAYLLTGKLDLHKINVNLPTCF